MSSRYDELQRRVLALSNNERKRLAGLLSQLAGGGAAAADGECRLIAYVVLREKHTSLDTDKLREVVRQQLPASMHPAIYVQLDALPRTEFGKVDRHSLPAPDATAGGGDVVPPRTDVEEAVAAIWQEVLGIELIGAFDDFFDLGGDSLIATRVISRVRARFGIDMTPRTLFERPRLAEFAARVSEWCGTAGST